MTTTTRGGLVVLGPTDDLQRILDDAGIRSLYTHDPIEAAAWLDLDDHAIMAYGPAVFGLALTGRRVRIETEPARPSMILLDRQAAQPAPVPHGEPTPVDDDPRRLVWLATRPLKVTSVRDLSHPDAIELLRRVVAEL